MITIAFDGYWLCKGPPSGVRVLESLITTWSTMFPDDKVVVIVPSIKNVKLSNTFDENIEVRVVPHRLKLHGLWVLFELRDTSVNAEYLVTQNFSCLRFKKPKFKNVVFLHDVVYKRHPKWFTHKERMYLKLIDISINRAWKVITSSDTEKSHILEYFPFLSEKLHTVGLDVPLKLAKVLPQPNPAISNLLNGNKYILSVGRLNIRKNINFLINSFLKSKASASHTLVIVGSPNGLNEVRFEESIKENVLFLGEIDDSLLAWLYMNASLFIYPSLDEGFGLPIIEAKYFGATVLASDIPIFNEIALADSYFDLNSKIDLIEKIDSLLNLESFNSSGSTKYMGSWKIVVSNIRELCR